MATVHYENGKFHVHKEVVKNERENDNAREKPSSKKDIPSNDQFCSSTLDETQQRLSDNEHSFFITAALPFSNCGKYDPPPKA